MKTLAVIVALLIIAGALLIYKLVNPGSKNTENIDLVQLYQKIDAGLLKQLTIKQNEAVAIDRDTGREYHTPLTNETAKNDLLKEGREPGTNGKPRVDKVDDDSGNSYLWPALYYLLPFVLIFGFWIFMLRQMQSGGNKALSFGKSRAKLLSNQQKRVTFKDVAGVEEAKEELQEIIEFLREPQKFQKLGGRIPKGVLLIGSPGYVAPEMWNNKGATFSTDLYSLGVILHECVTGTSPFEAEGPAGTMHKHLRYMPPPLIEVEPRTPIWLSRIVERLLEKEPEDRYGDALSITSAISEATKEIEVPPLPAETDETSETDKPFPSVQRKGKPTIEQLLFARVERVAARADFQVQLGLGGVRLPGRAARAARLYRVVLRMNAFLHSDLLGRPGKLPL
jgi:hypothetical protein